LVCIFLFKAYFLDNLFPCVAGTIIIFFLFSCLIFRFCILILFYGLMIVRLDLVLTLKHVNWKTMLFSAVQCLETITFDQYQASGLFCYLYFECKLFSFLFFICWFSLSTGFAPLWFTINTYFFLWMLQNYHTWLFEIFCFCFCVLGQIGPLCYADLRPGLNNFATVLSSLFIFYNLFVTA
jgi:hypothetical protein